MLASDGSGMAICSTGDRQQVIKNPYKRINQLAQLPLGCPSTNTQALPLQWWLKYPQKFHPPLLSWGLLQSQNPHAVIGLWFMKGRQNPSLNLAHLAFFPKQPMQMSLPVLQSMRSQPLTGTVTWRTPPVQPSQKPPSRTAKGVRSTAILQKGLWRDLWEVMQTRGRFLSQVTSPSKGLQLLQENLPAQLLLQLGQIVAWNVSPFFIGFRLNWSTLEIPPQSTPLTKHAISSTVSAN